MIEVIAKQIVNKMNTIETTRFSSEMFNEKMSAIKKDIKALAKDNIKFKYNVLGGPFSKSLSSSSLTS